MTPMQLGRLTLMLETRLRELSSGLRSRATVDDVDPAQLRLVEEALARIAEGTYGCCPGCNEEISVKRLTALPLAVYCIACQDSDRGEKKESQVSEERTGIQIAS